MIYLSLIKYILIALVLSSLVFVIHQNGRKVERAHWLQQQQDEQVKADAEKQKAEARIEKEKRAFDENFMRVINDKQKAQADLNQRIHELRTGGLWIDAKACASVPALPGKTKDPGIDDRTVDASGKIRIPGEIEAELISISEDAKMIVNKYNELRQICSPLVEIVD